MSVKALVFLVTVLAATTVSAASSDPVMWLWERAWPKAQPPAAVAEPAPVVPEVEAKPTPRPRPKVEAKPAATKPEKSVVKKPRAAVSWQQRRPTANECAQMRAYGRTVAKAGGRLRGYSDSQIDRAFRDCGL